MGDRRSRRLRNWRLRTKLAAVLVVPLLVIGTLGTLRVAASARDADALDALVGQVAAGQQVARLVDALQTERVFAEAYVAGGRRDGREPLDAQVRQVDAAAAAVVALPPAQFGPAAPDLEAAARDRLADLAALRRAVTGSAFPAERVGAAYTAVLEVILALEGAALTAAPPPLLRSAADAMTVAAAKEEVRRQHATVAAILTGAPTTALQDAARATAAQTTATFAELATAAAPALRDRWAATVAGAEVDARQRIEQRVLTALATGEPLPVGLAADWDRAARRTADLARDVEVAQQQQLAADGEALAASARAAAVRDGVLVALLVLVTLAVLVVVARSLLVPLRTLRGAAFQIARSRLPATIDGMTLVDGRVPDVRVKPIAVDSDEEIGEVARAFDAVHAAAVRLAGEQALLRRSVNDIFAHLGRRGQSLVGRQLAVLARMEAAERDPAHRDGLFELEHIATRMRRNTENLLVLAGEAQPRLVPDTPVRTLVAAAVAEIELHRMVVVGPLPEVDVRGAVVADLGHLLAELLENATTFAPLDSTVTLDGRLLPDGALAVEIVDEGLGMPRDELAKVNAELTEPPLFDPGVTRRTGLFVVGRLAHRHGIAVRLRVRHSGLGLVAGVTVPADLLAEPYLVPHATISSQGPAKPSAVS